MSKPSNWEKGKSHHHPVIFQLSAHQDEDRYHVNRAKTDRSRRLTPHGQGEGWKWDPQGGSRENGTRPLYPPLPPRPEQTSRWGAEPRAPGVKV